jgi:glycosyltransferase involved in cell wall biosynthesis
MVIAVMVSLSPINATRADRYFFNQALSHLASQQAEHHFYICTDAPQEVAVASGNVSSLLVPYVSSRGSLSSLWRTIKYRQLLHKISAEAVLYFGVGSYIKSQVPFCIMVKPGETGAKPSAKLLKVLERAKSVLTFSEGAKVSICQQYKVLEEKVSVVYAAAPEVLQPTGEDLHSKVKERYTDGCEYFIYTGSFKEQPSLINLLKAFSVFKKRQKTNWKLVLVNRESHLFPQFTEALRTYKYRDEVVVLEKEDEDLPLLLSAAYALVYPVEQEDYGLYILEAMHFRIPVLTKPNKMLKEIAGEAGLYYQNSVSDLAEKMMTLYKYETIRGQQVERLDEIMQRFSWEKTAGVIWNAIGKV